MPWLRSWIVCRGLTVHTEGYLQTEKSSINQIPNFELEVAATRIMTPGRMHVCLPETQSKWTFYSSKSKIYKRDAKARTCFIMAGLANLPPSLST